MSGRFFMFSAAKASERAGARLVSLVFSGYFKLRGRDTHIDFLRFVVSGRHDWHDVHSYVRFHWFTPFKTKLVAL